MGFVYSLAPKPLRKEHYNRLKGPRFLLAPDDHLAIPLYWVPSSVECQQWVWRTGKSFPALVSKLQSLSESPRRLVLSGLLGPNPRVSDSLRPGPAEYVSGVASTKVPCSTSGDQYFILSSKEVYSPGNTGSSALCPPAAAHVAHSDTWLRSDYLPVLCHQSENKTQPFGTLLSLSPASPVPSHPAPSPRPQLATLLFLSHTTFTLYFQLSGLVLIIASTWTAPPPALCMRRSFSTPRSYIWSLSWSNYVAFPKIWAAYDFLHARPS